MMLTAFCIGSASIVFQTIINNTVVTPCLLGMNSLYVLIHTLVAFVFGSGSMVVVGKLLSFSMDLVLMAIVSLFLYGMLFRKTKGNVLYILLTGTVMATLFASSHKVNSEIMVFAVLVIVGIILWLRKELALLDVIALGVTLLIAIATALVGPISFLGLITANLSRQLFRTYRHTYLMLGASLIGMITLIGGQALIEHVFHFGTNISVFINVGGGIYFLYLLLKNGRKS